MPPRPAPTARQRRLGAELRRMREAAAMSVLDAAEHLEVERTRISNMEAGRIGFSAERLRSLARVYRCPDAAYVDALVAMAEERGKGWWEEYRGRLGVAALDLAELEHHAVRMRGTQVTHLPGLLQTEEYARAVLSMDVPVPEASELRRMLSFRMRRRDVLDKDRPPKCVFLIHETAIRLEFGGSAVMRAQLRCLLDSSERENITIRAIPFSAGGFPSAGASINCVSGAVRQLDTVHFDTPAGVTFLEAPEALDRHRIIMDKIEELSLSVEKTRDFLLGIAKQL